MSEAEARPVVVLVSALGGPVAATLKAALGSETHVRAGAPGAAEADATFEDGPAHLRALFLGGAPIVAVAAAGVVIRALAPVLADKRAEPPVLALSPDGASVVPLLGGHRGANPLALEIASALQGRAAVTTAGDAAFGVALDAPPPGWALARPEDAGPAMAALLKAESVTLETPAGAPPPSFLAPLAAKARLAASARADGSVTISGGGAALRYAPQRLTLGVGAERGAPAAELHAALDALEADGVLDPAALACVATLDLKADEGAALEAARRYDRPLRLFAAATLEAETPRLATPSDVVFAAVGCHGVSEGAALAAAGPEARLLVPKRVAGQCTLAVASAPEPITTLAGRPRGRLDVVGLGPGKADWRTPAASRAVAAAEELVGYGFYIDLLGPAARGKVRRGFALGEEEARCRYALERAGEGARVALICSGDPGIYAMAALVFELLDRGDGPGGVSDAARRAEVVVEPGVSALQAASARSGALLGHDFCAISLSDLLTPWSVIERRVASAAAGDFVIAFYNPVSKTRRTQLARAREILLAHRGAETPVILAVDLGRPAERLTARTLGTLSVDEVDMLTTVLVGSSQSRAWKSSDLSAGAEGWRAYTPRGYAAKSAGDKSAGDKSAGDKSAGDKTAADRTDGGGGLPAPQDQARAAPGAAGGEGDQQ